MSETHKLHDPLVGKEVEISSRLADRLRGKYACGPTLPDGEPEFGWRQFETPPIQHEAAAEIERLRAALEPFAGDKMPALQRTVRAFNRYGLRCMMSPMEIAMVSAWKAIRGRPTPSSQGAGVDG